MSRDDGTAHSSVGELRQGKRNLFPFLFCLFRQTIEKSSVNNIIIAFRFFFGLTENPVQKPEKSSASPPFAAGFFLPKNWAKKHVIPQDHASYSAAVLHIFLRKMLHVPQVRFIKRFLISDKNL